MIKKNNLWVFGSTSGMLYNDNSRYFFEYICKQQQSHKAVWVSSEQSVIDHILSKGFDAVHKKSVRGIFVSLRAKYNVYSYSYDDLSLWSYIFSKNAIYVNLWHGIPLKKLAVKHTKVQKILKNLLRYKMHRDFDFMPTCSKKTTALLRNYFGDNIKYVNTGFPRSDALYSTSNKLDIFEDDKKTILYMPTFREPASGEDRKNIFLKFGFDSKKINMELQKNNAILYLKLHPRDAEIISNILDFEYSNIKILKLDKHTDIYEYMQHVDLLVTDYSSVYFDFLQLNKPILFTPFDISNYETNDRGFYLNYNQYTPGLHAYDWTEFTKLLKTALNDSRSFQSKRNTILKKMNDHRDGNNCERLFKCLTS